MKFAVKLGAFAIAIAAWTAVHLACGADQIAPIAVQFSRLYGPPDSGYWTDMRVPSIDNLGGAAFRAYFSDEIVNGGINTVYRSSNQQIVARVGDHAPGLPVDVPFQEIIHLQASLQGPAAFLGYARNDNGEIPREGIWAEDASGQLRLVALTGTEPPGVSSGTTLSSFAEWIYFSSSLNLWIPPPLPPFVVNGSGETAFYSLLDQSGSPHSSEGIWSEGGGQGLRLVVQRGMSVPQFSPGATIATIVTPEDAVRMNDAGVAAFTALAVDPDYVGGGGVGLFLDDPQQGLMVAVRSEQEAPGLPGVRFRNLLLPSLNNAGQIAFVAEQLADDPVAIPNYGIWAGSPGDLRLVTQTSALAPGTDGRFLSLHESLGWREYNLRPVINGQGEVAFAARITGPGVDESNDTGVWVQDVQGQLQLVAREGDVVDGDRTLDDLLALAGGLILNNQGQVAFQTTQGIWATDVAGLLHNIVHLGDELPVGSPYSDSLTMEEPERFGMGRSTGNQDGIGSGFNDRGELVFSAYDQFGYGIGVYLSQAVAVPEPAGMVLLGCLLGCCWNRVNRDQIGRKGVDESRSR